MKIDRENCEAWFLDYYEGNLSKEGVEEMYAFLILNPDMREVFDSYDEVSFSPDNKIYFEGKTDLKKSIEFSEGINETNYEEYFVGAVENVLSEEEKNQLEKFLVQYPAKREELDLLRKTILEPEAEIMFEHKSALKKSVLISEENFDEYAVAAMEGELSAEVMTEFNAFLSAHPAQQKEFELFAQTKLQPETEIVFEGKDALKKTPLVVTAENFDELAISSVEGLLNVEEEKTFVAAISGNEKLKKEFGLYAQTKLAADEYIIFDEKESLKREEKQRGMLWWMLDIRFSAAAAIALLIGIFVWTNSGNNAIDPSKKDFASNGNNDSDIISIVPNSNDKVASNVPKAGLLTLPKVRKKNDQPVDTHKNVNNSHYVASVVTPGKTSKTPVSGIAFTGAMPQLKTNNDQQVDFSGAYYDADFVIAPTNSSKGISPGQYAMRWMKDKLDRSANSKDDNDVYQSVAQNKDEKVTGFDLTSSAVNAIGEATGSNMHLVRNTQGTVFTVGKYHVWLNRN